MQARFQSILVDHKEEIIARWLKQIEFNDPKMHDINNLQNGESYFILATDIHIPLDEHPHFEIIPRMCAYHAERDTPLTHLLKSPHIWRQVIGDYLFDTMRSLDLGTAEVADYFRKLSLRIDKLQEYICDYYWEQAKHKIKVQEETIHQLHQDRLSLLGKMAASLAHEIRNPLFAIEGFLKLIQGQLGNANTAKVSNYFNVIENELKNVYGLITGFLSFSKNSGVEEAKQPCVLSEVMDDVLELASPRLIHENISVRWCGCDVEQVKVQKIAVKQVLSNLINNSIDALIESTQKDKYIAIQCKDQGDRIVAHIKDNGPGIPEDLKDMLFKPFVTGKEHGTGLGLPICKQIMEKNHGEITFSSVPGETTFTLTFFKTE